MMDTPAGEFPDVSLRYITVACQHCENPACAKVCPVGATYKDPETGVVRQDYDKCIGCRMCMAACPYTGVRSFNWEEPTYPIGLSPSATRTCRRIRSTWWRSARSATSGLHVGEEPACMQRVPCRVLATSGTIWTTRIPRCRSSSRTRVAMQLLPERGHQALRLLPRIRRKERYMSENASGDAVAEAPAAERFGRRRRSERSAYRRSAAAVSRSRASRSGPCSSPAAWSRPACATWIPGASTSPCSCSSWASPPAASSSRSVPQRVRHGGLRRHLEDRRLDVHLLHGARHRLRGGRPGPAAAPVGAVRVLQPGLAARCGTSSCWAAYLILSVVYLWAYAALRGAARASAAALRVVSVIALVCAVLVHSVTAWIFGLQQAPRDVAHRALGPLVRVARRSCAAWRSVLVVVHRAAQGRATSSSTQAIVVKTGQDARARSWCVDLYFFGCDLLTEGFPGGHRAPRSWPCSTTGPLAPFFWIEVVGCALCCRRVLRAEAAHEPAHRGRRRSWPSSASSASACSCWWAASRCRISTMPVAVTPYTVTGWESGMTGRLPGHGVLPDPARVRRDAGRYRPGRAPAAGGAEVPAAQADGEVALGSLRRQRTGARPEAGSDRRMRLVAAASACRIHGSFLGGGAHGRYGFRPSHVGRMA